MTRYRSNAYRALSLAAIRNVRQARVNGARPIDLAREYGVSKRTIYRTCAGRLEEGEIGGRRVVVQFVDGHAPEVIAWGEEVSA